MVENRFDFLKYFKDIGEKIVHTQEDLLTKRVEVEVGGGMVKVIANGKGEIVKIIIDNNLIEGKDKVMIEELVKAGVNEALHKSNQLIVDKYLQYITTTFFKQSPFV